MNFTIITNVLVAVNFLVHAFLPDPHFQRCANVFFIFKTSKSPHLC